MMARKRGVFVYAIRKGDGRFNGAAPMMARKLRSRRPRPDTKNSFNGAAPMMARKPASRSRGLSPSPRCFNGAAPMMARKLERYRLPVRL